MFPYPAGESNLAMTALRMEDVRELMNRQLWFDLAGFLLENQIQGLLRWVRDDR
jgi:hypothetical protein